MIEINKNNIGNYDKYLMILIISDRDNLPNIYDISLRNIVLRYEDK